MHNNFNHHIKNENELSSIDVTKFSKDERKELLRRLLEFEEHERQQQSIQSVPIFINENPNNAIVQQPNMMEELRQYAKEEINDVKYEPDMDVPEAPYETNVFPGIASPSPRSRLLYLPSALWVTG